MAVFNSGGAVGLIIEAGSVKAVAVGRVRGEASVTTFLEARIGTPADDENYRDILIAAIRELFDANDLPRDRVVAAVSSSDAVLRRVSLPFQDEARIRKTIKFEVEDALPFPIESCVADYHVGRRTEGKSEVLVAAVAKDEVRELLGILEECGLEVVALEMDLAAMANAASWAGVPAEPSLLVDIGEHVTRAIVYDGSIVFWRGFRTESGGDADVVKRLAAELHRSLLSADLERDPEVLYLSGSHPGVSQFSGALSESMGMEVRNYSVQTEHVGTAGLVALGCALKCTGHDVSTINLRQDEFVYRKKFEQLTPALTVLASFVLACGILWNIRLSGVRGFAIGEQGEIHKNAVQLWEDARVDEDPPVTVGRMRDRVGELLEYIKPNTTRKKAVHSILDEWREWSARVPDGLDVTFDDISMRQKRIQLSGIVEDVGKAEELQSALSEDGRFTFDMPSTVTTKDGTTRFTLRHEYK